ncbi:MAG: sodium:proton antiporter, partial [Desulfobacula sp.]|nr:sodium:proton antiporter [Desulfobacula sp.]
MKLDRLAVLMALLAVFVFFTPAVAKDHSDGPTHDTLEASGHAENVSDHTSEKGGHGHVNLGEKLPLYSCIPFACMLLSIALLPLIAGTFWHHHFGKISAFWAACLALPFIIAYKGLAVYEIFHIILADYVPFIILLWALFTISGGILLKGTLRGTPLVNTII